jgi:hypothetical protein
VDAHQGRTREDEPKLLAKDPAGRAERERADPQRNDALARACAIELERQPGGGRGPLGEEQADTLVAEPPCRVAEHARRGGIEPLHIVDGDQHWALGGECPKGIREGDRDRARVAPGIDSVGHE